MAKKKSKAKKSPNKPVKKMVKKTIAKPAKKTNKQVMLPKKVKKLTLKSSKKPSIKSVATRTAPKKVLANVKKLSPTDYSKVITPLADRVVIRLVQTEKMTAGGLYIPDTVNSVQGHLKGVVLAAGIGARSKKGNKMSMDVVVGDHVFFNEYSATKIEFNGEELHIVKESEVLGVAQ